VFTILLEVCNVNKDYGDKTIIENLNLNLNNKEIIAIMGSNGIGKTTLLNIITGLIRPDSGEIYIKKINPFDDVKARKHIGYIPIDGFLYDHLNAYENLEMIANLYGINFKDIDIIMLLEQVGLELTDAKKATGTYSLGMKQKLNFACGLIHNPDIIILDEPFNGLDPNSTKNFKKLLKKLSQTGKGIIFTSHLPETIIELANKVVIMNNKKITAQQELNENSNVAKLLEWFEETLHKKESENK